MTEQVPGLYRRRVGELVVTAINDGFLDLPLEAMQGIEPRDASALLTGRFRRPTPRSSVNAYLIEGRGRTILIDTGGGGMAPTLGHLPANLAAAGVQLADVDLVLLTHLHPDHTGALLTQDGAAAFANAELAFAEAEAGFWLDDARAAAMPEDRQATFKSAKAAVAPYSSRTRHFSNGAPVALGITPVPLPGHTPGHTGYRIDDGDDALLIWADVMHVPDVQSVHPEVTMMFDVDGDQAIESRRRVLDMAATDRLAVAGMHLHFPAFSHVARAGQGYALVPETWLAEV